VNQVLQNLRNGVTEVADVPCPQVKAGGLLVRTHVSLISAGTERSMVQFGKAGWINKARQQPDKVRMALAKIRTDGPGPTLQSIRNKLDQPLPLGYCNVGTVLSVGREARGFKPGDRVVSNGNHAEVVSVAANLSARIPDPVGDEAAAFTVIGAIGLQGVRLAVPSLGETFVVIGLGLIGLTTVQLLRAHGCRVIGLDLDRGRLQLAESLGAEAVSARQEDDPVAVISKLTRGRGADGALITAATSSNTPVRLAAESCRKRGRIILIGVAGLKLVRSDFYHKELSFQVSCAYGPGRYDPSYEDRAQDYPLPYVRWTAQRNFEAVLDMLAEGRLDFSHLISHRFPIERSSEAYQLVDAGGSGALGILLEYPSERERSNETVTAPAVHLKNAPSPGTRACVGAIGAGNYASQVLFPAFRKAGAELRAVASQGGVSSLQAARKFGFATATTDVDAILRDPAIDTVVIATRHDTHADWVCRALRAGKHVFVEKPLGITAAQIDEIESTITSLQEAGRAPLLMVGFNRRFAPQVRRVKQLISAVNVPRSFIMTVNAGQIPAEHWSQQASVGGGRIVGEGCHFVDLLRHLAGAPLVRMEAARLETAPPYDTASITLGFADGSLGAIHYFANGNRSWPKERLEVFCAGRILELSNYRMLRGYGWPGFKKMNLWSQDKGQGACVAAFVDAVRSGGASPIAAHELFEVSRASINIAERVSSGATASAIA